MYIAKGYFDTKFKKSFKKGDVVPAEIAEVYLKYVIKEGDDELLVETPSEVTVTTVTVEKDESKEDEILVDEEPKKVKKIKKTEEKTKKKGFWN